MATPGSWTKFAFAAATLFAVGAAPSHAFDRPVGGKQERWEQGYWSAVPQVRDGKVSQCVLVARRGRAGKDGEIATNLSLNISRGAGFAFGIRDAAIGSENILDDQAEVILDDGRAFPAVGFDVAAGALALHPGDAAAVLAGLAKTKTLRLLSAGVGLDTGVIDLDLPADALGWLEACGRTFDIAIDRPTDPKAPALPVPRPRSPKIGSAQPTPAGPPGIEDKQKIAGWDASELRARDGSIVVCLIRRHYATGSDKNARLLGTFLFLSRAKGLTLMFKDSALDLAADQPIAATFTTDGKPFIGFAAQTISKDEIGLYPQHGMMLALALENSERAELKSKANGGLEFPVGRGVIGWLRACGRRNGIPLEPAAH